ncbi:MAG: peptidase M56, partial [Clostridia bacterium]|nr:peptidase M56 [Clostridia bacterium]
MTDLFIKILNMSISASWLVLAVLLLRLLLKKAPKWLHVVLWGIVGLRLLCPFSIESALSLIPSAETVSPAIMLDATPTIHSGVASIDRVVNPVITESFASAELASANPLQIWIPVYSVLWLVGIAAMLLYTAVSYLRLCRRVRTAVRLRDNIYQSENAASPFVLGMVRPKIYLPFGISEQNTAHVIAHEEAHLARRDHLIKPIGFLLLTVYWFNPVLWVAYILLCRDIELACDERVIAQLGTEARADYSEALLACSVSRRMISACPLAFGEVGVKARVKNVL